MSEQIVSAFEAGVVQIRINRPEKKNALTSDMYAALVQSLTQAEQNAAVRVITLTRSADTFSSGNDVADFVRLGASLSDELPVRQFLRAIASVSKPLIAGVNGMAIGIGVTMLLHCDLVYAADSASFQMPFTSLGITPEAASSQLLPLRVGYHRAAELLLFGERIDAHRALEIGLINAVCPAAELPAWVMSRAALLAAKPAASILATKRLLRREPESIAARMDAENVEFDRLLQSPETQAIMQAFLDRRKAGA